MRAVALLACAAGAMATPEVSDHDVNLRRTSRYFTRHLPVTRHLPLVTRSPVAPLSCFVQFAQWMTVHGKSFRGE